MTLAIPPSSDSTYVTALYEEWRGQVLTGNRRGPGLAILLGRGMKAWLEVAAARDAPPASPWPEVAADAGPLRTLPAAWRTQLTAVLTGMVLHGAQPGRHA